MSKSNVKPFDALNSGDRISDVLSSLMALWAAKYNPDEIFCDLNSIGFNIKSRKRIVFCIILTVVSMQR